MEQREEAEKKLKALGRLAAADLLEASKGSDSEAASRAKRLLRILDLRETLPPALLKHHPGAEDRLVGGGHEWTKLFLLAAAEVQPNQPRGVPPELRRTDLEPLAAEALRGAETPEEREGVSRIISRLGLLNAVPALVEMLGSTSAEVRAAACYPLGSLERREVAPQIIPLLRDPRTAEAAGSSLVELRAWRSYPAIVALFSDKDAGARRAAVKVVGELRIRDALPALRLLLGDPDPETCREAILALDRMRDRHELGTLIRLARSPDPGIQHAVGFSVSHGHEPEVETAILDWLKNPHPSLLPYAVPAAGNLRLGAAVPHLLRIIQTEAGDTLATQAARSIAEIRDQSSIKPLRELLRHPAAKVQEAVLTALVEMNAREALPDLEPRLASTDAPVRAGTLRALARLGHQEGARKVAGFLKDPDADVREAAVEALLWLQAKEEANSLIPLLQDPQARVIRQAAAAITALRPEGALDGLLGLLGQGRYFPTDALLSLGVERRLPQIRKLLKDPRARVREEAAYLLGRLNDKESIAEVALLLKDPDPGVRCAGGWAMGAVKAEGWLEAVVKLLDFPDSKYRAASALGNWGGPAALPALAQYCLDPDETFRYRLVENLIRAGKQDALPHLLRMLEDPDRQVRSRVRGELMELDARSALPEIVKSMERREDDDWDWLCIDAVAFGFPEAIPMLARRSANSGSSVRARIFGTVARVKAQECVPDLRLALKADAAVVAGAAAEALGWLGDEESLPAIRGLSRHPDEEARQGAARGLCILGEREGARVLLEEHGKHRFVLNRLRQPEMWKKLAATPRPAALTDVPRARLEQLASAAGVPLEIAPSILARSNALTDSGTWSYRRDMVSVLDGLGEDDRSIDVVLEADRIRVLSALSGERFWRAWWKGEVNKK